MRWQQLSLRYFLAPILRVRSWCMSLSIEPPRTSQWTTGGICWSSLRLAEGIFLLGQPLPASIVIVCSWSSKYYVFLAIDLFSDHKAQGPMYIWACVPTIIIIIILLLLLLLLLLLRTKKKKINFENHKMIN